LAEVELIDPNGVPTGFLLGSTNLSVSFDGAAVIPVPAAVWLFGTALIGLVGFGKRKTAA
jgi:hypothetical protein